MGIHHIHFRTFVHATESPEKVRSALAHVVGDVEIAENKTSGHFGNPLIILETKLKKNRDIKALMLRLKEEGIVDYLLQNLGDRLDDECNFHFRLSKQKALEEILAIAEDKDVIACTAKVAAYPANRENALAVIEEYLTGL